MLLLTLSLILLPQHCSSLCSWRLLVLVLLLLFTNPSPSHNPSPAITMLLSITGARPFMLAAAPHLFDQSSGHIITITLIDPHHSSSTSYSSNSCMLHAPTPTHAACSPLCSSYSCLLIPRLLLRLLVLRLLLMLLLFNMLLAPSTHGVPTPHVPLISMHDAPATSSYSSCSFYPHMPRHSCSKNSCSYYSYAPATATHALTLMHAPSTHACSSYFLLVLSSCILLLLLVLCYYSWSYYLYLLLRLFMLLLLT